MILTVPVKSGWMLRSVPFAPEGAELPLKMAALKSHFVSPDPSECIPMTSVNHHIALVNIIWMFSKDSDVIMHLRSHALHPFENLEREFQTNAIATCLFSQQ